MVTGVLNSSSVTAVLVVGFATAGVMSLEQSVAVIMGANVFSGFIVPLFQRNNGRHATSAAQDAGVWMRDRWLGHALASIEILVFERIEIREGITALRRLMGLRVVVEPES